MSGYNQCGLKRIWDHLGLFNMCANLTIVSWVQKVGFAVSVENVGGLHFFMEVTAIQSKHV